MPFESTQSTPAQQPAGPVAVPEPQAPAVTEAQLTSPNDGLDAEDLFGSVDDADQAILDAAAHPAQP